MLNLPGWILNEFINYLHMYDLLCYSKSLIWNQNVGSLETAYTEKNSGEKYFFQIHTSNDKKDKKDVIRLNFSQIPIFICYEMKSTPKIT